MEQLADFYVEKRNSTWAQEIQKLIHIERVRAMATKHRWFFKKNYGMIRSLLVQDFVVEKMNPIFASLTLMAYLGSLFTMKQISEDMNNFHLITMSWWCLGSKWSDIVVSRGCKPLLGKIKIHKALLRKNTTQLSMSGDTPFARGRLAEDVGYDGKGDAVENLLDRTYD